MAAENHQFPAPGGRPRRLGAILRVIACCALCVPASAPSAAADVPPAGFRLLVTPSKLVVPADHLTDDQVLEVRNEGRLAQDLTVKLSAFVQQPDGKVAFHENAPYSAVDWLAVTPNHFSVAPGARQQVSVRIHVPRNADPGDHAVAVSFVSQPAKSSGNIRIAQAIGVTTVITVPGATFDNVAVADVQAPGFSAGGPIHLAVTLHNTGTVHRTFDDKLEPLTAKVGSTAVDFGDATVLRGATRTVPATWKSPPLFCLCHISVSVPNPDGHASTRSATIVVLPVYRVVTVLAALAVCLTAILLLRKLYRRRLAAAMETGWREGQQGQAAAAATTEAT